MKDIAQIAEAAARAGGEELRHRPAHVSHKGAIDLVTEIDLAAEERIRGVLARLSPGVAIQGEEGGGPTSGTRWVVDPLDGTTNFVHGYPFYCVSIGFVEDRLPVAGCIYDPLRDHAVTAWRAGGCFLNGARVRVSETALPDVALGVTGFPYDRRENADFYLAYVERVLRHTQGMRRSGSAAMDLSTVARGQVDFFWEFRLKPWDTSAGYALVTEAGGRVTRLDGSPWDPDQPEVLATNGRLHDALVRLLAE